jgi:23S rRNA (guanosine2251-2'-O)-methyltransferase
MRKLKLHELQRISTNEFKFTKKTPLVLALDNVRSMHNVGSLFRIADAFLLEKIYLCGITAVPPHREISKTALGAEDTVDWEHCNDLCALIDNLKKQNYLIIGVEQADASVPLHKFNVQADVKHCLIFGNEVFGIDQKVLDKVDYCVEIPQFGTKHSLNIAVAAGIAIWDLFIKTKQDSD